jgi:hypothetical protein
MSVKVSALCWLVPLPSTAKFVLIRLADFAGNNGKRVFPAIGTVANDCGLSPRAVQRAFKVLCDEGVLVLERATKGGRGHTNVYSLDLKRIEELGGGSVPDQGGPSSGLSNGFDHAENHDSVTGFNAAENHDSATGFPINPVTQSQNPDCVSPEPLLTVEEDSDANASGAAAPSGGTVVPFPLDDKAKLLGPVLASLTARLPSTDPDEIRSLLFRAYHKLAPQTALDLGAMAAIKDEPWSWLCAAINTRIKSKAAGGRQAPSDAMSAGARDLLAALDDPNFTYGVRR